MPTLCTDVREVELHPDDKTVNGQCIQCGECCSNFLPMTDAEIAAVARYIKDHGIKPMRHFPAVLMRPMFDMCCPFLDTKKDKEKCTIYPARPAICKRFSCHYMTDKAAERRMLRGLGDEGWFEKAKIVNVRATFFPTVGKEVAR